MVNNILLVSLHMYVHTYIAAVYSTHVLYKSRTYVVYTVNILLLLFVGMDVVQGVLTL